MNKRETNVQTVLVIVTVISLLLAVTSVIFGIFSISYAKKLANQTDEIAQSVGIVEKTESETDDEDEIAAAGEEAGGSSEDPQGSAVLMDGNQEITDPLLFLKEKLSNGDSVVSTLRFLYPGEVVLYDDGAYHFVPIDYSLMQNTYESNQFGYDDKGRMVFYGEAGEDVLTGIDVSKFQGEIDWNKVKEDGVDYAILRVGIRGYGEGKLVEDETFAANYEGAVAAGIPVGVYFFTEAVNEAEAVEEAEFVLQLLQGKTLAYPVYIDVEDVNKSSCRTNFLTKDRRTEITKAFLDRIGQAGYNTGIYGNLETFMLMLDCSKLEGIEKWYADYALPLDLPYQFITLQYSDRGSVAGIKEPVDLNIRIPLVEG